MPSIGDEFTSSQQLSGVTGTLANDPVSQVGGLTYDWSVIYNPDHVVLRLEKIVPEPGSATRLVLGGRWMARRRRGRGERSPLDSSLDPELPLLISSPTLR